MDYPGANDEPGHRDIDVQNHYVTGALTNNPAPSPQPVADVIPGIVTFEYNFAKSRNYGWDAFNNPLNNTMTSDQEDRLREVLEIFGIRLVSTSWRQMVRGQRLWLAICSLPITLAAKG